MKNNRLFFLLVIVFCLMGFSSISIKAQNNSDKNKQVKLLPNTLEIIEVTKTADKCPDQKGITVRLRVISESPVDIRRWANLGNNWLPADFLNQKKGNEISTYMCNPVANFKFYSRAAGSSDKFPKP